MKTLAIVYEEPPEQVFVNAASACGITVEQARKAFGQMICDAQPTIINDAEPAVLALNSRGIHTMLAVEGRGRPHFTVGPIDAARLGDEHPIAPQRTAPKRAAGQR